jgi:hypothetical protein
MSRWEVEFVFGGSCIGQLQAASLLEALADWFKTPLPPALVIIDMQTLSLSTPHVAAAAAASGGAR